MECFQEKRNVSIRSDTFVLKKKNLLNTFSKRLKSESAEGDAIFTSKSYLSLFILVYASKHPCDNFFLSFHVASLIRNDPSLRR